MPRRLQQPVHNSLSETIRGKSLRIDFGDTFIIEFSQDRIQMSGNAVFIPAAADTFTTSAVYPESISSVPIIPVFSPAA